MTKLEKTLTKFISVHGNTYDYSLVEYNGSLNDVIIICKKHGKFNQKIYNHNSGKGCSKCGREKTATASKPSKIELIEQFNNVHNNLYDYALIDYVSAHKKVKIICKNHNTFEQTPASHNNGSGCPKCGVELSGFNRLKLYSKNKKLGNKPGVFYKLLFTHINLNFSFIKVGITSVSIKKRYNKKCYKDYSYKIIEEVKCTNLESAQLEHNYININKEQKFIFPDNVKFIGYTECFKIKEL